MENLEKLYDAFGELVYVVAMADGIIQKEESETLEKILEGNPWAKEIKWSFDYEIEHKNPIEYTYKKVLDICHEYGPRSEYVNLIEILEAVAQSSKTVESEKEVINKFTLELTELFRADIETLGEY